MNYSTQLSVALALVFFLSLSVGEGKASAVKLDSFVDVANAGVPDKFMNKPQVFSDQTVLTGEKQQMTAISYVVEKGDSVTTIADRYNMHVATLLEANNIAGKDAESIKVGQTLIIPSTDSNTSSNWLSELNAEKAKELAIQQAKDAAAKQKLARASRLTSSTRGTSTNVSVTGRVRFTSKYPWGWCTSWASHMRGDLPGNLGNAITWYSNAKRAGFSVGHTPRAGAVMVTSESGWGHVAYVTSVSGGSFRVSEMNYAGYGVVSTRDVSANSGFIIGFIY